MPAFGSFALLFALALSIYTLCAGTIALRQLATGSSGRVSRIDWRKPRGAPA